MKISLPPLDIHTPHNVQSVHGHPWQSSYRPCGNQTIYISGTSSDPTSIFCDLLNQAVQCVIRYCANNNFLTEVVRIVRHRNPRVCRVHCVFIYVFPGFVRSKRSHRARWRVIFRNWFWAFSHDGIDSSVSLQNGADWNAGCRRFNHQTNNTRFTYIKPPANQSTKEVLHEFFA